MTVQSSCGISRQENVAKLISDIVVLSIPSCLVPTVKFSRVEVPDTTIRLWDTTTDRCLKTLYGHSNQIVTVDFGADSNTVVCASLDRTVKLWDITTGQCLRSVEGYTDWAFPVAFGSIPTPLNLNKEGYGGILASISSDYKVRLWNIQTGKCYQTLAGHRDHIWSVAFSPDGKTVASGGADCQIRLWNVDSGECYQILVGHQDWVRAIRFSSRWTNFG